MEKVDKIYFFPWSTVVCRIIVVFEVLKKKHLLTFEPEAHGLISFVLVLPHALQ